MPINKTIHNDDGKELCKLLDRLGASEEIRQEHQQNGKEYELLQTFAEKVLLVSNSNSFIFGGWSEGTLLSNMYGSDIDELLCNTRHPVITDPVESTPDELCFMMIYDKSLRPGYVKLQPFVNKEEFTDHSAQMFGVSIHNTDSQGRLCLDHATAYNDFCNQKFPYLSKHGPAYRNEFLKISTDIIPAFRCASVPSPFSSWINHYKNCVWPSKALIDNLIKLGCFFVPVGHIHSPQPDIEWRVSFSLQERQIMFSLTPVQHKCYTFLKAVQNKVIEPLVKDAISSYHMKTSIFHLKALTVEEFWSKENFCICIRMCFLILLSWFDRKFCPNWFIPEQNLFEKHVRLKNVERKNLKKTLYSLVFKKSPRHFFTDSLERFDLCPTNPGYRLMIKFITLFRRETIRKHVYSAQVTDTSWNIIEFPDEKLYNYVIVLNMFWILGRLMKIPKLTSEFHSTQECETSRRSLSLMFTSIFMQIYGSIAWTNEEWRGRFYLLTTQPLSLMVTETYLESFNYSKRVGISDWKLDFIVTCLEWYESGGYQNDMITSATVLATILYMSGDYFKANLYLSRAESNDKKDDVFNVCECNCVPVFLCVYVIKQMIEKDILLQTAPCVIFTIHHLPIIPKALYFELIRTKAPIRLTKDFSLHKIWTFWAVVDARIYLYFLRYLVFKELKKRNKQKEACKRLRRIIRKSERYGSNTNDTRYVWYCLGHIETAFNLLGWIYVQEGVYDAAVHCFMSSWKKKRNLNAAKWHMALLLFDSMI